MPSSSRSGPPTPAGPLPSSSGGRRGRRLVRAAAVFGAGALCAVLLSGVPDARAPGDPSSVRAGVASGLGGVLAALQESPPPELGPGEFLFLPNRRTIWVVNRSDGRFAHYDFGEPGDTTGRRSSVITLDSRRFPASDTLFLLSDRYLTDELWVCNRETGDIKLWKPQADGDVVAEGEVTGGDLGTGEHVFLPSRRTVWVINRDTGRLATYHFKDDQKNTIVRSRIVSFDTRDFPPSESVFRVSDRNFSDVLWVANRETGDIQLWQPKPDGDVALAAQIETLYDLEPK